MLDNEKPDNVLTDNQDDMFGLYNLDPADIEATVMGIYFKYKAHLFIYQILNRYKKLSKENIVDEVKLLDVRPDESPKHLLEVRNNEFKLVEITFIPGKLQNILSQILVIKNLDVEYCVKNRLEETFIVLQDIYLNNCIIDANNKNLYFSV